MAIMRLDNFIRSSGAAGHRQAKALTAAGRVTVNGAVVYDSSLRCDSGWDIRLDGRPLAVKDSVCLMMNKPAGYICATESTEYKTVLDLLGSAYGDSCLFPVGRLDLESEGLLLLTDDGELCRKVISPDSGIVKEYFIRTDRPFPEGTERLFEEGIRLKGGAECRPARITVDPGRTSARVFISEGKYRQVRRMALAAGVRVAYLKRLAIGGLRLDEGLSPGEYRQLSAEEIAAVFR